MSYIHSDEKEKFKLTRTVCINVCVWKIDAEKHKTNFFCIKIDEKKGKQNNTRSKEI